MAVCPRCGGQLLSCGCLWGREPTYARHTEPSPEYLTYPIYADGEAISVAPHDLRRTYARLLHDAQVPVVAIQQNLGHATLETTLRYIGDLHIEQRKPPPILRPNMSWLKAEN